MADIRTFDLPDLGEGLTEGEILRWLVAAGDTVTLNQPIVEVETAKAAVEIPSPFAGVVTVLHHEEGTTVEVGSPLIAIDTAPDAASPPSSVPGAHADADQAAPALTAPDAAPGTAGVDAPLGAGSGSGGAGVSASAGGGGSTGSESVAGGTAAGRTAGSGTVGSGAAGGGEPEGGGSGESGGGEAPGGRTPVLVGYGPRSGGPARRRARRHAAPESENTSLSGSGLSGDRAEPTPDDTLPLLPTIPDALAAGAKPVRHGGLEMGRAAERAATAAGTVTALPTGGVHRAHPTITARPRAKPPVRKLARDLGVDLATISATGPDGTVTRDDVRAAAVRASTGAPAALSPDAAPIGGAAPFGGAATDPASPTSAGAVPDSGAAPDSGAMPGSSAMPGSGAASGSSAGSVESIGAGAFPGGVREQRVAVRGVRKLTAAAMVDSVATAPHVTEWLTVDVTRTLRAVERLRANRSFADVRVNPLLLVAKAVTLATRRHPELNSSWVDGPDGAEIVLKDYVNLGIAAATPRGLMVPNIKDAGRLGLPELAAALDSLVSVAKAGRTPPADLAGGTITITNVGVFGVDAGTPILNPGEAAILCVGQIAERPWVHKGVVKPRSVCQLALSFDHRIVDGEGGSKFLADVGRFLEDPEGTALAWS
ncbi:dihydrolipoamide acetyltransferase family protein [Cryptosporangium arvum]|uniref:dihydrolipoamide acetyltransferase family protein n=1 Tax=Cryptosporangium arvum TaxID=80871 RepID=UPI0004B35384|nr:dihydrolipoamide acetyltransferase family protein [Cryptosporangium arvum]